MSTTPHTLIPISVAGANRLNQIDGKRARVKADESPLAAIIRSIERRTKTVCCAGPRLDSMTMDGSRKTFQATFGRRIGAGTYAVEGELWIYLDAVKQALGEVAP